MCVYGEFSLRILSLALVWLCWQMARGGWEGGTMRHRGFVHLRWAVCVGHDQLWRGKLSAMKHSVLLHQCVSVHCWLLSSAFQNCPINIARSCRMDKSGCSKVFHKNFQTDVWLWLKEICLSASHGLFIKDHSLLFSLVWLVLDPSRTVGSRFIFYNCHFH